MKIEIEVHEKLNLNNNPLHIRTSPLVPREDPRPGGRDGEDAGIGTSLRRQHSRLQAAQGLSQGDRAAEDSVGLRVHHQHEHRGVEDDALVGYQCGTDGDGLQEVRQGCQVSVKMHKL